MDKYLLEILKEFNTIIIPGLGALTITDASTGEIMFMTYLKHDDGQLAKHIAEKEGVDETEAKNVIAKYVREISTKLDQGESYDMFQFGSFYKNDAGDVDFKAWDKSKKTKVGDATKKEEKKKPAEEKVTKKTEKKTEEKKPVSKEKTTAKKSTTKKETTSKKESTTKKDTLKKVETPKAVTDEKKVEIPIEKKDTKPVTTKEEKTETVKKELNIEEKEELAKNQEKLEVLKKTEPDSKEGKKRGVGFYILIIVIALIGAGSIYVAFDYDNIKQHIPFLADNTEQTQEEKDPLEEMAEMIGDETNTTEEESESEESENIVEGGETMETDSEEQVEDAAEDIIVEKEPVVVEVQAPPPSSGSGNYHIIAGAFSSEANAERLASKFRDQGYKVTIGQVNGLNLVSIGSYATSGDAQQALPEMRSAAPSAWVYSGGL